MKLDRSHLTVFLLGMGLGTLIHFVDWNRVQESTANISAASAGGIALVLGIVQAIKLRPEELEGKSFQINSSPGEGPGHRSP
jgi:hypothetical protein